MRGKINARESFNSGLWRLTREIKFESCECGIN